MASETPFLSIVIPAYNEERVIEASVARILDSDYPNLDVIVADDGSKDRTGEIGHSHARVRVIDIPNGGLSAARNVGLREATGTIVASTYADGEAATLTMTATFGTVAQDITLILGNFGQTGGVTAGQVTKSSDGYEPPF